MWTYDTLQMFWNKARTSIGRLLIILGVVAVWQGLTQSAGSLVPPPSEVFQAFVDSFMEGEIVGHAAASLQRVLVGFLAATGMGVILGIFFGYYRNVGEYFQPLIELLRSIPPIAWIPIAILLFGIGNFSASFIVFLGAFFPIFTNAHFGAISLPVLYRNIARSFELGRMVFLIRILFPFSLPYIFTGLRIGIGMAWMSVIAAELVGAQSGLGYFIQMNRLLLRTDNVLVGMVVIGVIGFGLTRLLLVAERLAVPWNRINHA